jgi:hypothetical protein
MSKLKKYMYKVPFDVLYTEDGKIKFLEPKFNIGDKVRYTNTSEVKMAIREITSICYIEGTREFDYWVTGIGHAVEEELLIKAKKYNRPISCKRCKFKEHQENIDENHGCDYSDWYECRLSGYKHIKREVFDSNKRPKWCEYE